MTALPEPLEIGSADARVASPVPSDYSPPASFAPLSTARLGRGEEGGTNWKLSVARASQERSAAVNAFDERERGADRDLRAAGPGDVGGKGAGLNGEIRREADASVKGRGPGGNSAGAPPEGLKLILPPEEAGENGDYSVNEGGGAGGGGRRGRGGEGGEQEVRNREGTANPKAEVGKGGGGRPGGARPPVNGSAASHSNAAGGGGGGESNTRPGELSVDLWVADAAEAAPQSARISMDSFSIGREDWWGGHDRGEGQNDGEHGRGGGGGEGGGGGGGGDSSGGSGGSGSGSGSGDALTPAGGGGEDEKMPYAPGQEGAGGGPSPGGAGFGAGGSSVAGGDSGRSPAWQGGAGVGGVAGNSGGTEPGGASVGVEMVAVLAPSGRELGETELARSTTDLQNMPPASLLRQTSKYLHEDLPMAKRRQNQRARAKRRKRISFADEHGDDLHHTNYKQDLYYSKDGLPAPGKQGGCCTIS